MFEIPDDDGFWDNFSLEEDTNPCLRNKTSNDPEELTSNISNIGTRTCSENILGKNVKRSNALLGTKPGTSGDPIQSKKRSERKFPGPAGLLPSMKVQLYLCAFRHLLSTTCNGTYSATSQQLVRQQVAGPSKASTDAQQVSELNLLPITTRREVTSKAGIKERASMTTEAALAMKETVGLTWRIILKHHRLLELAADDIDKTIYNDKNQHRSDNSRLLSDYGSNWKTLTQTKEEIAFLEGCIALGNADPSSQTWADKLERAQD
ncbi:hypothetical protein RRG08_027079, partial [Elysia crispata]